MYNSNSAIGVFDSGMGGLTVLKEIIKLLPAENTIYYADAANCPYGEKTKEQVKELTVNSIEKLILQGVKIIIVACNTASTSAVSYLRKTYPIEFVAMEPAVKPAAETSISGTIGVLATKRTLEGDALKKLKERWQNVQIVSLAGDGLVEAVEQNREDSPEVEALILGYVEHFAKAGTDKLVLGCTHYPFLSKQLQKAIGARPITIINPAPAIARRVEELLSKKNMLRTSKKPATHWFQSSLNTEYNAMLEDKLAKISKE